MSFTKIEVWRYLGMHVPSKTPRRHPHSSNGASVRALVQKIPVGREHERHAETIRRRNHFGVAYGSFGCDDRGAAGFRGFFQPVGKRKESVAGAGGPLRVFAGTDAGDPYGAHAVR